MKVPTIHMNGDSKQTLEDLHLAAYRAINDAINALSACSPNGRNYYPQGNDAIQTAIREHQERINRMAAVRGEIEELLMAIQDGGAQ